MEVQPSSALQLQRRFSLFSRVPLLALARVLTALPRKRRDAPISMRNFQPACVTMPASHVMHVVLEPAIQWFANAAKSTAKCFDCEVKSIRQAKIFAQLQMNERNSPSHSSEVHLHAQHTMRLFIEMNKNFGAR